MTPADAVYSWKKNRRELVLATLEEFNGHELASIRVFAFNDAGTLIPTPKGIALRVEHLPNLLAAVQALTTAWETQAA